MRFSLKIFLVSAVLAIGLLGNVSQAKAQESALTAAFSSGVRVELGKTVAAFQEFLGTKYGLRVWAGAGSTLDGNGRLVGSFAALFGPVPLAKGLDTAVGVALLGQEGKKGKLDGVVHFRVAPGQAAGLSYAPEAGRVGLFYVRRI